jgi:hypothetical protein
LNIWWSLVGVEAVQMMPVVGVQAGLELEQD